MRLSTSLIASLLVLVTASVAQASGDDVVFLKNGGRVRGTVVSEDPQEGVQIKLATGAVKAVGADEVERVQYGGSKNGGAPAGSLHVDAASPGQVFLDGGLVGRAPADVAATMPGVHVVRVEFDQGGSREQRILVQAGEDARVKLDLPEAAVGFGARSGASFGIGVEGGVIIFPRLGNTPYAFPVGTGQLLVNIALAPTVDLRATAYAGASQGEFTLIPVGGSFGARFNIGSAYSISAGFRGGVAISAGKNGSAALAVFGPEVSPVGFRFGDKREFSFELTERVGFYDASGFISATTEHALALQYLFL